MGIDASEYHCITSLPISMPSSEPEILGPCGVDVADLEQGAPEPAAPDGSAECPALTS